MTMSLQGTDAPPSLCVEGAVATVTLRRPEHRNRLHAEDLAVLLAHFRAINENEGIRVVVLTAAVPLPAQIRPPVFCAGYHMQEHGHESQGAGFEQVAQMLESLRPVTVCALNGSVYGGAVDLVLACDFAIGVWGIEMRMPAAAIGLHFYPGGLSRFVSRLGVGSAKRAFLAAETFDASTLLSMGFVQRLVPSPDLEDAVQERINDVLALAPMAVDMLKRSLNEIARGEFDVERLHERHERSRASEDFFEGCLAFSQRRAPVFQGR